MLRLAEAVVVVVVEQISTPTEQQIVRALLAAVVHMQITQQLQRQLMELAVHRVQVEPVQLSVLAAEVAQEAQVFHEPQVVLVESVY